MQSEMQAEFLFLAYKQKMFLMWEKYLQDEMNSCLSLSK